MSELDVSREIGAKIANVTGQGYYKLYNRLIAPLYVPTTDSASRLNILASYASTIDDQHFCRVSFSSQPKFMLTCDIPSEIFDPRE